MQEKLFSYGTLQIPEVQLKVIGRVVTSSHDTLIGFKKTSIIINNNTYPIIEESPNSSEEVNGLVLDIKPEDLKALDEYETPAYMRKKVTLKSGITAWAYIKP